MPSIDDRIVSLQFDNKTFGDRVENTIGLLDRLKKALGFQNEKDSFKEIEAASNQVKFNGMSSALTGISSKFTALGAVAFTVLQNITNRVVDAGIQLVKSFSIAPIIDGFREYETTIKSVQTILSNTKSDGTTIDQVNTALKQLNDYSDKTIYNFGEMARNIGTFTAAGVDLDTSVASIKGIANLAALSGSSAEQAAVGMYQLSQAIATGTVRLMDWNSVTNAGMGGEVFQKALFETGKKLKTIKGVDMGTTFEQWTSGGNSFRSSLEQNWLAAEVLTSTLQQFTGDMTEAQLQAQGYTKEQIAQILELGKTGLEAATKVKTFTQLMGTIKESIGSGWAESFKLVLGDFAGASELFTKINDVFGKLVTNSANSRNNILAMWSYLGGRTALIESLRNVFIGLKQTLTAVASAFREVFPRKTAQDLYDLTIRFKEFTRDMIPSLETLEKIKTIMTGVFSAFRIGIEVVKGIAAGFKTLWDRFASANGERVVDFLVNLAQKTTAAKDTLVKSGSIVKFFTDLADGIADLISRAVNGDILQTIKDFFLGISVSGDQLDGAKEKFQSFKDGVVNTVGGIGNFIAGLGEKVLDGIRTLVENVKKGFQTYTFDDTFSTVNSGIFAIFTASLALSLRNAFKNFDFKGVGRGINAVLTETVATLQAMQSQLKADAIKKISVAIGILAGSLLLMSLVNPEALARSVSALGVVGAQLLTFTGIFQKIGIDALGAVQFAVVATGMISLAAAVTILSVAVRAMSTIEWEELGRGLSAVAGVLTIFVGVSKLLSSNGGTMILAGVAMSAFAVGLVLMAGVIKTFAIIDTKDVARGLISIAAGLTVMTVALNAMNVFAPVKAAAILILASSLYLIAGAMVAFKGIMWSDVQKGLVGVGGGLLLIAGAMAVMPGFMQLKAAALLVISFALKNLASALIEMSALSWGELARGLTAIAVGLIAIGAASSVMSTGILGAVAIGIVAVALGTLAKSIKLLATIGFKQLASGLLVFAVTMGAIALAASLLGPSVIPLLAFGAAIFLVGAGIALLGTGLIALTAAIATLIASVVGGLGTLIKYAGDILKFILEFAKMFVMAFIFIVVEIAKALPEIVLLLGKAIAAVLKVLVDNIPEAVKVIVVLIAEMLKAIADLSPDIVKTGFAVLMDLLKGIRDNIGEIVNVVADIMVKFFEEMTKRLPELTAKGSDFLVALLEGIAKDLAKVVSAAGDVVIAFLDGLADKAADIVEAGVDVIVGVVEGLGKGAVKMANAATDAVVAFIDSIDDNMLKVIQAGWDMIIDFINGIADSIEDNLPRLKEAGKNLASAIIDGMTLGLASKAGSVVDKVKGIGSDILGGLGGVLRINSPSKATMAMGESVNEGLSIGLTRSAETMRAATELGTGVTDVLRDTLNRIPDIIEGANIRPTITPVMDLSQATKDILALSTRSTFGVFTGATANMQASMVASDDDISNNGTPAVNGGITFVQNNNSPKALSAADIYRQTRTQLQMAREELKV